MRHTRVIWVIGFFESRRSPLFLCLKLISNLFQMLGNLGMALTFFRNFFRRKDGTTAIEFSLMAIPYVMLTIGILELSIMYASASLLEGATTSASRLVKTGQIQQAAGDPQQMFRDELCSHVTALVNCNDVQLEVVPIDSYANYDNYGPTDNEDGDLVSQGFDVGGSNDQILIRAVYRYQMMTPFVGQLLAGSSGERLFVSTIVLQTEPYEFEGEA
jgi:Flp pilus assembly protein TadG